MFSFGNEATQNSLKMIRIENNIIFNDDFNDDLFSGFSMITDEFSPTSDESLLMPDELSIIPNGIESVTFGKEFNKPLGHYGFGSYLPKSVKSIELKGNFDQVVDYLPKYLECLHFSKDCIFNKQITKWSPGLEILRFGDNFNAPIYSLPPNLKILELGNKFNYPINPVIYPKKLFTICFGNSFNQCIDDLPDSVENIKLGDSFNQNIVYFPKNIKYIEFGKNFNQKETLERLPTTLKRLSICSSFPFQKEIKEKLGNIIFVKI